MDDNYLLNNNNILEELINNQRKTVPLEKRLTTNDMKRIAKNIKTSIFNNKCSLWKGFITNKPNNKKYVNFYFRKKKIAINRLLYINYIGDLLPNEYLKYICNNQGCCCNINHIKKKNNTTNYNTQVIPKNKKEPKPKLIKKNKIYFD